MNSIALSLDGQYIVSGSEDTKIRIWDFETGTTVFDPLEGYTKEVWYIAYRPDGWYIVSESNDTTIRIWDAATGAAVGKPLEGHIGGVLSVAYSPDGQRIISGTADKIKHSNLGCCDSWKASNRAL